MVLIDDKKYACETCIKGHRSTSCTHTERPLFEIQKKGRPVTQCEHCRELRKVKQVHVKCRCGGGDDNKASTASAAKKGAPKLLPAASFPNGVPHEDRGCDCDSTGVCNCAHARTSSCSSDKKIKPAMKTPPLSHVLARIAELRPVLPKVAPIENPSHDPSSGIAHGHSRTFTHQNMSFSPYVRAYHEQNRPALSTCSAGSSSDAVRALSNTSDPSPVRTPASDHPLFIAPEISEEVPQDVLTEAVSNLIGESDFSNLADSLENWMSSDSVPAACGCGNECSCPGCPDHQPGSLLLPGTEFSSCTNLETCMSCLHRTLSSLPSQEFAIPNSTPALELPSNLDAQYIDDWIRQIPAGPDDQTFNFDFAAPTHTPDPFLEVPDVARSRSSSTSSSSTHQKEANVLYFATPRPNPFLPHYPPPPPTTSSAYSDDAGEHPGQPAPPTQDPFVEYQYDFVLN